MKNMLNDVLDVNDAYSEAESNYAKLKDKKSFKEQVLAHRKVLYRHACWASLCLSLGFLSDLTIFGMLAASFSWLYVVGVFIFGFFCFIGFLNHLVFMVVYSLTELKK